LKLTKEIRIALLIISVVLLFIFGFNYLKGKNLFNKEMNLYAVYERVDGVSTGTDVILNGLVIGNVLKVDYIAENHKNIVKFRIRKDIPLSINTKAEITDVGLIRGKAIALIPAFDNAAKVKSRDTLKTSVKKGITQSISSGIVPIEKKINNVLTNLDSILTKFNTIFNDKKQDELKKTLSNLSEMTTNLNTASQSINNVLGSKGENLKSTFESIEKTSNNLEKITDSLAQSNLKETITYLESSLKELNETLITINDGEGNISKLLHDKDLYDNLTKSIQEIELLMEDIRLNPKRYIHFSLFGKKQKPYKTKTAEQK